MQNNRNNRITWMIGVLLLAALLSSCRKNAPAVPTAAPSPAPVTQTPAETRAPEEQHTAPTPDGSAAPSETPANDPSVRPPEVSDHRETPEPSAAPPSGNGGGSGSTSTGEKVIESELGIDIVIPPEENTEENAEKLERIETLIARVYEVKSEFQGKLSGLESDAAEEYLALPAEERSDEKKKEIGMKYYGMATDLENQCDVRIDSICAELQLLLSQVSGDQAVVREIRSEYSAEKEALKDAYFSKYGGYLN